MGGSVTNLLKSCNYDYVIETVHLTAGITDISTIDADGLEHPSITLKLLGHDLKKARIKQAQGIRKATKERETHTKNFLKLVDTDWMDQISFPPLSTISTLHFENLEELYIKVRRRISFLNNPNSGDGKNLQHFEERAHKT